LARLLEAVSQERTLVVDKFVAISGGEEAAHAAGAFR
jgi:hypothetical protein